MNAGERLHTDFFDQQAAAVNQIARLKLRNKSNAAFAGGLAGLRLRGFDFRGVGPAQADEPVGGAAGVVVNTDYVFPIYEQYDARLREHIPVLRGIVFFGFPLHAPGRPSADRGAHLREVGVPMLFLQGTRDSLAQLPLLEPLCDALGEAVTLHVVDGGDHSFHVLKRSGRSDDEALDELAETVDGWTSALA